jgi:hypothetical protein
MTDTPKYNIQPLTDGETRILTKVLKKAYLTGLAILCMATILYIVVVFAIDNNLSRSIVLVMIGLDTVILIITILATRNIRHDIINGVKEVREYQILDKISYLDDDPGLGGGPKMKYQLITKFKKFTVDEIFYNNANIDCWIIEHEAPLTKESFKLELK